MPDQFRFLDSAAELVKTGTFQAQGAAAWEMPGTAIFLGLFIRLFDGPQASLLAIRLAQAILVGVQAIMIGALAWRIFRTRPVSIIAATLAGFYPFFLYYQGLAVSETLFDFLLVAGMLALY